MEQFLGKFLLLRDKMEGFDDFAKEFELSAGVIDLFKSDKTLTITLSQNSDGSYKDVTTVDGTEVMGFDFRLGEKSLTNLAGYKTEDLYTLEGNRLNGEHVHILEGKQSKSSRYWQGEYLIFDAVAKGKVWKSYYQKV